MNFFQENGRVEFSFFHTALVGFLKENGFELIISLFEIGDQPVNDVLKRGILNDGFERFTTKFRLTTWTLVAGWDLSEKMVNTPFAKSAHAFIDSVGIAINTFAKPAC